MADWGSTIFSAWPSLSICALTVQLQEGRERAWRIVWGVPGSQVWKGSITLPLISQECCHKGWSNPWRNCNFYLFYFIYLWLCWVFVSMRGLSPVVASGDHSSSWCAGLSPSRPLLLRSIGSRRAGSVIVAHGPSCSAACGIFPDQGTNLHPLHWQADSQPLRHQGSPGTAILRK